jgi:hypothetical protein
MRRGASTVGVDEEIDLFTVLEEKVRLRPNGIPARNGLRFGSNWHLGEGSQVAKPPSKLRQFDGLGPNHWAGPAY